MYYCCEVGCVVVWSVLPQSFVTVPSNAMVLPCVKLIVSFGIGRVFVNVPTNVKFSGLLTLFFRALCPVVPPFQACWPRKKLLVSSHQSVFVNVLFM